MNFGERVRAMRLERRWSRETLAAAAGISTGSVSNVEANRNVSVDSAAKLAVAFGVPIAALFDDGADATERALPGWGRLTGEQHAAVRAIVAGMAGAPPLEPEARAAVEEYDRDLQRRTRRQVAEDPPAAEGPRGA